jgi:hypothetical protein
MSNPQLDDFMEAGSKAYGIVDGAIDGFLGLMGQELGDSKHSDAIFLALETVLIQHAARIHLFRGKQFGDRFATAEKFRGLAGTIFKDITRDHMKVQR